MKYILKVLFFITTSTLFSQNLNISNTGQTGTSGTNWSLSGNVLTITGNAEVNTSVINSHIANNSLSFSGVVNLNVNGDISWSSNSTLTLNASQNIFIYTNITASGSTPTLNIFYGGSNATNVPNSSFTYALSQRNRNKISFSSTSAIYRVGNESYTICLNLSQLSQAMSSATSSTRVALGASINLTQTYTNSLFPIIFSGKFDGLGNVIDGLKIRNSGGVSVKGDLGLFSQLQGATIRNIGVTNVDIVTNSTDAGTTGSEFRIGALAGNIGNSSLGTTGYSSTAYTTTIESVWSSGNISTANNFTSDNETSGDRQKFFFAGGIVGSVNNGTANISRCYSYCNVSSNGSYTNNYALGGIVGDAGKNISVPRPHIIGSNADLIINIEKSFSTGSIISGSYNSSVGYYGTGGIIGVMFISGSSINNCYSWGNAVSTASFGGITGFSAGGTISNSYTTQSSLGSLNSATVSNLYANVTGTSPTTGTTLPTGFSSSIWSKANGERVVLIDLETPPNILYVKVTAGQSSTCGNLSIGYTITDASGTAVTLSSLGLTGTSGTPIFTINNLTPPGAYTDVSYLSGLVLTGTNASSYTLNPFTTASSHTITGTCTNYQISFFGNGNTSGTAPANIIFNGSTTIPSQGSLVNTGNIFLGWNTAANGTGTSYTAGATYSTASNLTLYAQWVNPSNLGCITIVASGGVAENSGWVANYNTIRPSSSTAVNINASDLVSKLGSSNVKIMGNCITISSPVTYTTNTKTLELEATTTIVQNEAITLSGPLSMTAGGNITINGNINTSTGNASGDILFKSAGDVSISSSKTITTNGGDVIIWANSDGNSTSSATDGSIVINHTSSISTSGGHLWIGGGSGAKTWNGLNVGDGYAVAGTAINVGFGSSFTTGFCIMRSTINTNGGDIYIAAQNNKSGFTAPLVNYGTTVIDAGLGKIKIEGRSSVGATSSFATGMHSGLGGISSANLTIKSSHNTSSNNAIEIDVTNVSSVATVVEGNTLIQSTGAGKILITSTSTGSGKGIELGYTGTNSPGYLDILSATGDITLNTGASGLDITSTSLSSTLGFKAGSSVTSSTANIRIISNLINTVGVLNNNTTGTLTIEPVTNNSFSSALNTTQIRYSSGITGLIIGNQTNTSNITIGSSTSINGPIEIYGGTIALNNNIATTNTTIGNIIISGSAISGNGNIAIADNRTATLSIGSSAVYNGVISGSGANFIKQGSGNLTLTGTNTYTGTTTLTQGNLQIGNGGTTGTIGTGDVINNTSLTYNRTNDYTISGLISGTGSLTKQGSGTLTLSQNNTYSGLNTISAGTLVLQNNAPNPSNKTFSGTGQLRIEPTSNSFTSSFSNTGWNINSTLTGLTIGKLSNTANVSIDVADTIAGPITVFGGVVTANSNLTTTTASPISLFAKSGLRFGLSGVTLQTGGGAVLLSGDHDADNSGNIIGSGALTITSNGGAISMGGGSTGTDFAYGMGTSSVIANDQTTGIWIRGVVNINSGNGDISIRGYAANASPTSLNIPMWGVGLGVGAALNTNPASVSINSGTGKILIEGYARNPSGGNSNSTGVIFNNWEATTTQPLTITSANTTSDAIKLIGNTENTAIGQRAKNGLRFWSSNSNILATANGGGIMLSAKTFDGNDHPQISWGGGNILATSGPIVINSENEALEIVNDMYVGSQSGVSGNTASSSNIRFSIDDIAVSTGKLVRVASTGTLTIEPFGSSFMDYTQNPNILKGFTTSAWTLDSTLGGFTLGKLGNLAAVTFVNNTTISGPITAYGGTVNMNGNITLKSILQNSPIQLFSTNDIDFNGTVNLTTNNGEITLEADSDNEGNGNFYLTGMNVNSGTGNVNIKTRSFQESGGVINTSGNIKIEPSVASFGNNPLLMSSISIANTASSLIIGKASNVSNITLGSSISIAGPITIYGGTLLLNENLTSSNGSTISLYGNGLSIATGKTISSTGGTLILAPQTASNTIGLGGAAGTLQLPASYFSTNFTDGFSNIQIGSNSQTGNISMNAITLRDNMTLLTTGSLTLGGKPVLGNNNLTLGSAISSITGMPTQYFQTNGTGSVVRPITNNTNFLFPVGNSSYNPVTITNKTGTLDTFSIGVLDSTYLDGVSSGIISKSYVKRTWNISKNTASANTGSGVDLTFNWNANEIVGTLSNPTLNHYNGTAWEIPTMGTSSVSGNSLTYTGYKGTFSPFAIGGSSTFALPVELKSFVAECNSDQVKVEWTTSSEKNNERFELYKSSDAKEWTKIYTIQGQGTKATETNYTFNDFVKMGNTSYYKLIDIDFNGQTNESPLIVSDCDFTSSISSVSPNPAKDYIEITIPFEENSSYNIIDLNGRAMMSGVLLSRKTRVNIEGLATGIYIIEINRPSEKRQIKIIKQ